MSYFGTNMSIFSIYLPNCCFFSFFFFFFEKVQTVAKATDCQLKERISFLNIISHFQFTLL